MTLLCQQLYVWLSFSKEHWYVDTMGYIHLETPCIIDVISSELILWRKDMSAI